MQSSGRTPSSILRKRANKENEGKDGKRHKMRGRRVSFAPDENLETMHLYQKDKGYDDDDMQVTEDLASRMPLYGAAAAAAAAAPQALEDEHHLGLGLGAAPSSPGANLLSPLSMDLTNNSIDVPHMAHMQQQAQQQPVGVAGALAPIQPQAGTEFTRNITSAIPALSTLVEEDEEAGLDSGYALPNQATSQPPADMTVSMDLTGPASQGFQAAMHGADADDGLGLGDGFMSPLPNAQAPGIAGLGDMQADMMTPNSPYALNEIMGSLGADGAAGDDTDNNMKNKWGFTPGADDTLNVSHGRLVMGDTTYNHVYGNGTTGDITRAMKASQEAAAADEGHLRTMTSRSTVAAMANASAAALTGAVVRGAPAAGSGGGTMELGMGQALHAHQTPMMPMQNMQAEMTINLLAEDNNTDVWRQPFGLGAKAGAGRASVASSKPPGGLMQAPIETPGLLAGGSTTALLDGGMASASAAAAASVAAGRTATNYTMQLLADGYTTKGPLQHFMSKMQAQTQMQAPHQAGLEAQAPRDPEFTAASSSLPLIRPSQGQQDATLGSMEFNMAVQNAAGGSGNSMGLFEEQALTLDDFAMPPELAQGRPSFDPGAVSGGLSQQLGMGMSQSQQMQMQQPPQQPASQQMQMQPLLSQSHQPAFASQQQQQMQSQGMEQLGLGAWNSQQSSLPGASLIMDAAANKGLMMSQDGLSSMQLASMASQQQIIVRGGSGALNNTGPLGSMVPNSQQPGMGMTQSQPQQMMSLSFASPGPQLLDATLPPISFQEFLNIVEVRFLDDMRRRTSFVQPFEGLGADTEPTPRTLAELLEAAHVSGARTSMQREEIEKQAERVESLQAAILEAEGAVARGNPRIFRAVQLASPVELDRMRDQMKLLKRACRHRTQMAWKQARIEYEQALGAKYRGAMGSLEEEAHLLKGFVESAQELEAAINSTHAAILQRVQQDHTDFKVAQAAKERQAYTRQRVAEMAAANEAREAKLEGLRAQQSELKSKYEEALQRKAALARSLQTLRGQNVRQEATPTRSTPSRPSPTASALQEQLAAKHESLDLLLGLQGIQLDARALATSGTWSLTVHGKFVARVDMGQPAGSGPCTVTLQPLASGFQGSEPARALLQPLGALCSSEVRVGSAAEVPAALQGLLARATAAAQLVGQLEAAVAHWPALTRISVGQASTTAGACAEAAGEDSTGAQAEPSEAGAAATAPSSPVLTLWFVQPQGGWAAAATAAKGPARLAVSLSLPGLLGACMGLGGKGAGTYDAGCMAGLGLTASITSLPLSAAPARSRRALEMLTMQGVPAGHLLLPCLCKAASELVQLDEDSWAAPSKSAMERADQVLDNPLFA